MTRPIHVPAVGFVLAVALGAAASPRESVTYTSVASGSSAPGTLGENALGLNGVQVRSPFFQGGYPARRLLVTGSLLRVHTLSSSTEAVVTLYPPAGRPPIVLRPWSVNEFAGGNTLAVLPAAGIGFNLPQEFDPRGGWQVRFGETVQTAAVNTADATWGSVTILVDDEQTFPPNADQLGVLGATYTHGPVSLAPGGVVWLRVTLPDASPQNHGYVDIDTEGTQLLPANATALALFDAQGVLVAQDSVDGSGSLSQLSFGPRAGSRPAAGGGGLAYDGRDGYLVGGEYYLAAASAGAQVAPSDWGFTPSGPNSGSLQINLRSGQRAQAPQPSARDLGAIGIDRTIPSGAEPLIGMFPGQPLWLSFSIEEDARHCLGKYLDIDFETTTLQPSNNPKVGLYTDRGALVVIDDDDGSSLLPLLSFGQVSPTRAAIGSGVIRQGQDGPLYSGVYFMVLMGSTTGATIGDAFAVGTPTHGTGLVTMHVRGNLRVGARPCNRADVAGLGGTPGADGAITPDDIVVYLAAFFAGQVAVADLASLGGSSFSDGAITVDDLVYFLSQFFAPCLP